MQKATFSTVVRATGDQPSITITTADADRDGDIVVPEGLDLAAFRKNPVVLWAHDYRSLPIGSTTSLDVEPGRGIRATWAWLDGDDFAMRVKRAFDAGVVRAASIGFVPLEAEPLGAGRGMRYTRAELLEWSLVPVPANAAAVRTLKALGLAAPDAGAVLELDGPVPGLGFGAGPGDEPVVDVDVSPVVDVDPALLRVAMLSTIPGLVRETLRGVVREQVERTLARARGRVD